MRASILIVATVFSLSQAWEWDSDFVTVTEADLTLEKPGSRIVGGTPTSIENFPYAVQVQQNNQLTCGGTLITRRHVLSAAHCFVDANTPIPNPAQFSIRAGTSQRGQGGSVYRVSTIVVHHAYNVRTQDADAAVLVLASTASLGSRVAVARVPQQGQNVFYNTALVHVGWGRLEEGVPALPTALQAVTVLKINYTVCAERYRNLPVYLGGPLFLTTNMMCAGLLDIGGADACQGDSGGPLLYGDIVVGVTSWGYGCGHPTYPGVSTRVSAFTNWINSTVTQFNGSPSLGSTNAVLLLTSILASLAFMVKEV